MFDHVKFGVSDMPPAKRSFCRLAPLGVTLVGEGERATAQSWPAAAMLSMPLSKCGKTGAATFAFRADSREQVDAFWQRRWPPEEGQRRAGATAKLPRQLLRRVVIAPDGHNIEAVCHLAGNGGYRCGKIHTSSAGSVRWQCSASRSAVP
jgi:hypothetical protein